MKGPKSNRKAKGANKSRREFLTKLASIPAGAVLAKMGLLNQEASAATKHDESSPKPPNILFILVDEMRFPKVFPAGITTPDQFLQTFMPNTYKLWLNGVKFANHHTAASACTPARGVLISGLYSQQSWCVLTILDTPTSQIALQPPLNPAFPTYGKLLRQAGYRTPYIGKWHVSIPRANEGRLEEYGFDGRTFPDPTGVNLQGTFGDDTTDPSLPYFNDADIANQAFDWLSKSQINDDPWCLTVGFVNPHDKEFFPAGTEFQTFTDLFTNPTINPQMLQQHNNYSTSECGVAVPWAQNVLQSPPNFGYPTVPPNWESLDHLQTKPKFQTVSHQFTALVWGGVTDNPTQTSFSIVPYPTPTLQWGIGTAPFSYWQRSLDSYTQILQLLDKNIGKVVDAMPPEVAQNTVIIFTSDHGDYASAHGLVSGKTSTFYDEAVRVPLIVTDPSGRFTGDTDIVRNQLTSSADFLPLIVSLGYNGSQKWMKGDLAQLYKGRHDMVPMLRSAKAPGRQYVLFATDETISSYYNFLDAANHIVGIRTKDGKLGVYAKWQNGTTNIVFDNTLELEFYDYATPGGVAETDNRPNDPRAKGLFNRLVHDLIPHELQAPLPSSLQGFQAASKVRLLAYLQFLDGLSEQEWLDGAATSILGYGLNVP
jgi:arylsulfatase A-like enzyme